MVVTTANLSSGPKLDKGIDKGVHIIRLVADTGGAAGGPPPGGGPHAAKNIVASPTDILVFDHQPWHFVNDQVVSHDTAHHDYPETILRVRAEKERVNPAKDDARLLARAATWDGPETDFAALAEEVTSKNHSPGSRRRGGCSSSRSEK